MRPRCLALVTTALLALPGCGSDASDRDPAPEALPPVGAAPSPFEGTFRVSGQTTETAGGEGREIAGTIVLVQDGLSYTASFDLTTIFPTPEGPTEARVVGTGEGRLESGELHGVADTQVILAEVPGVDAEFAFLPRSYGPRLRSRSVTRINDDGSLLIEIESEGTEGARYRATTTTMGGTRISPAR